MKRVFLVALLCVCSFAAVKAGLTQSIFVSGPISLEDVKPNTKTLGPVYTLRLLQVNRTKPTEYVWLLQREDGPTRGDVEPNVTVFHSLDDPNFRQFVSHLPTNTCIMHSSINMTGPDPTMKVGSTSEPGLQDFINFCRSKKIDFVFGSAF